MSGFTKRWWVATVVAFTGVTVGCDSSADPATTTIEVSPPTTPAESTVPVTPPTEAAPTTAAPTTAPVTAPDTTQPAPTTTTVEDELLIAFDRAQTAMRNCHKAAPNCDQPELESALVGPHRQAITEESQSGTTYENVDALKWTILDGPSLRGSELAVFIVCRYDPTVVTYPDGRVDATPYYFRQEWYFVPAGNTWKLSEVVNDPDDPLEEPCEE